MSVLFSVIGNPHLLFLRRFSYPKSLKMASTDDRMTGEPSLSPSKIYTAAGDFTCAQVVACALLRMHPKFRNAEIVRTNSLEGIRPQDAIVGIGDASEPENFRFKAEAALNVAFSAFNAGRGPKLPLSLAGLVYVHHGKDLLRGVVGSLVDDCIYSLYEKVYETFLVEVDAMAHGFPIGFTPTKYRISTDLTTRISRLSVMARRSYADEGRGFFERACDVVDGEFRERVEYYIHVWGPARELVKQAVQSRRHIYPTGEVIQLGNAGCPWNEHLFFCEEELGVHVPIKYVVFEDSRSNDWRVQAVPVAAKSFVLRRGLKESWRGLRDDNLSGISGIPGCIFVHASGFIGGNRTHDGAVQMAIKSLSD